MTNRALIVTAVVVGLLGFGWLWTRPPPIPVTNPVVTAAPTPQPTPSPIPPSAPSQPPGDHFRIAIENAKPGALAPVLKATQGDSVTIDITSDRPGTLEIHGYQKRIDVVPGSAATLSFVADIAGRFPVDLHGRDGHHLDVTALEVQPR